MHRNLQECDLCSAKSQQTNNHQQPLKSIRNFLKHSQNLILDLQDLYFSLSSIQSAGETSTGLIIT